VKETISIATHSANVFKGKGESNCPIDEGLNSEDSSVGPKAHHSSFDDD